jgi:hypothetical protein
VASLVNLVAADVNATLQKLHANHTLPPIDLTFDKITGQCGNFSFSATPGGWFAANSDQVGVTMSKTVVLALLVVLARR